MIQFGRGTAGFVLAATLMAASAGHAATTPAKPGILVQPFDLFDTSIDHRPMVVAAQKRWLADAAAAMRGKLDAGKMVHVVATKASATMTAATLASYQHPSTCRSCALAEARKVGAAYVFIGSVHKVSDLIIYMRGELDKVGDPTPLMVKSMEVKADDKTMVVRGADAMAAAVERHILAPPG